MAAPDECLDDHELRCENGSLAGIIRVHHGIRCLEVKCTTWHCTKGKTVSAFHYYSLETGDEVDTVIYTNPFGGKKK